MRKGFKTQNKQGFTKPDEKEYTTEHGLFYIKSIEKESKNSEPIYKFVSCKTSDIEFVLEEEEVLRWVSTPPIDMKAGKTTYTPIYQAIFSVVTINDIVEEIELMQFDFSSLDYKRKYIYKNNNIINVEIPTAELQD